MAHRIIGGDEMRTVYEDAPELKIISNRDELTTIQLTYHSAPAKPGDRARLTRLTFTNVFEYRFVASEQEYSWTDDEDYEFTLIEILNSGQIKRLLDSGMYRNDPPGTRLSGIDEARLHHYRIGFDEYGTFDILCLGIRDEELWTIAT